MSAQYAQFIKKLQVQHTFALYDVMARRVIFLRDLESGV